jgi:PKD repeat protein/type II secretory pathway pseudopilin PulG
MPNAKRNPYFALKPVFCSQHHESVSQSLVSPAMTIGLTLAVVVAIAIILFAANITIINAQQLTNRPSVTQNGTRLFEGTEDSFRLQVPEGWIIHDVNNTGSTFSEESTQGYGILAQLCPQEEGQGQEAAAAPSNNVSGSGGGGDTVRCQGSEGDIIHIVRYPDLDTRLQVPNNITTTNNNNNVTTIDNILLYHMQKLEEVGYRNITIVNSTYTAVNIINPQTNQTISIVPAKTVEMKYRTSASAPNEIREGYFILTATNATHPNVGMTKGYSIFYEGTSTAASAATAATIQETTTTVTPSGSLPLPPAAVRQVFDSFELIAAQEVEEPTNPLTVDITSSDTEGGEIAPATFEFEADVAGGTEPYTYSWDFDGEGSGESNEQTVSHTFEEDGSYDVGLTVTDSIGQSASDSMEITVEEAPAAEEDEVEAPAAEEDEVEPDLDDVDNNSRSDDLIDVDDFLDDLFDRLGLNN